MTTSSVAPESAPLQPPAQAPCATPHARIAVLGAGMVGVATALELQRLGAQVTLIDRRDPGLETSYGNAGVIARSSLMPFNHPDLWKALPTLLRNRGTSFRYHLPFVLRQWRWVLGFLGHARPGPFAETTAALDALIRLSTTEHQRLLAEVGESRRLRDNGWLFLYRSQAAFAAGQLGRNTLDHFGVRTQPLDAAGLQALEPALQPIFARALWIQDTLSVDSPGQVVQAYARAFAARGGTLRQQGLRTARLRSDGRWDLVDDSGQASPEAQAYDHVVVALGPWSPQFLATLGMDVPMGFERGYHMHYAAGDGAPPLQRPVYDTGGGYVLSPMEQGLRLSTGVELTGRDAPANLAQLELAETAARQALPLGGRLESAPWMGRRPTLPDSRPIIGPAPGRRGLWLAFGHQHIGFSTGTGTARLLGAQMFGQPLPLDARPFRAERFVRG